MVTALTSFIRLVAWLLALLLAPVAMAQSALDLSSVPLNQVVSLYYKEAVTGPYVICNDVLADERRVSVRAGGAVLDEVAFFALLDAHGFEAVTESGVTLVCKKREAKAASSVFVYRPKYRDSAYLVDFLSGLIKGEFANKRHATGAVAVGGGAEGSVASQPSTSGTYRSSNGDDFIVFSGSDKERDKLIQLLAQVDVPSGEVVVKGYLYEVGRNESDGAALDLVVSVLSGHLQAEIAGSVLGHALRIKTGSINAVASALSVDGRFRVVTSPFTRVRSGGVARFVVGSEVPVLGSLVMGQSGQTQQSVEYRSSGTIFEVSPRVRGDVTELDIFQQVSAFVNTETGVNGSPTLNKRELRTSLSVADGEVLVIGGLNDVTHDQTKSGLPFLPFASSRTETERSTEVLLVLEVTRL